MFRSIHIDEKDLAALTKSLQTSHEAEKHFHKNAITELRKTYDQIDRKLSTLLDIRLNNSITQEEYDKKAHELKQSQTELRIHIEQHQKGQDDFRITMESLLSLMSTACEMLDSSKVEQKRQLIAFVFSNLKLRGKKLEYTMRSPFNLLVNCPDHSGWLGDVDSNHGKQSQNLLSYR